MPTLKSLIFIILLASLTACSSGLNVLPTATPVLPTFTASPPTATSVPVAIKVNDDSISIDEFNAELARYQAAQTALGNSLTDQAAAGPLIEAFIAQLLLAQGAKEAGFTLDDSALQARIDALVAKLGGADKLSAWQQAHGYSDQGFRVVLKREAAVAWMRDKLMAGVPNSAEQVHIRQILLYNQDNAQRILDRLQAGTDFDEIAAQVDTSGARGDIGWFARDYLAEKPVEDAAFALEPGKVSAIIQDKVGFHIIKLIERQANRPLSSDAVLTLQNRAVEDWLVKRRQQSNIVLAPK